MSAIKRVFLNVSMINRIDGLQKVAADAKIKLSEMHDGDYLIFVNRDRTKIAALVGKQLGPTQQIMAYTKLGKGQTLDLRVITEIPKHFDGRKINYNEALSDAISKALTRKGSQSKIIESIG